MQELTSEGQRIASDLSQRYGFSVDAVTHMMFSVLNGNGSMAQFNHPEFAGSGQWMQGGMIMVGDMFNYGLKGSIDGLCNEISNMLANQPGLLRSGSFQSQSQSGSGQQMQGSGVPMGQNSLFVPDPSDNWWPQDLGAPNSVGSQNNVKYAYFAGPCRLAVNTGNDVWLYDTLDHQIGGFSQQQGMGSSIIFSSQYGTVNLSTLPVVSRNGQSVAQPSQAPAPVEYQQNNSYSNPNSNFNANGSTSNQFSGNDQSHSVFDALAKLGDLREKGILTDDEFANKKAELLARL